VDLTELNLKVSYDSSEDNIVEDFLVPVLSCSKKYLRITGFFSSTALSVASRGLFPFVKNGGQMKIISSIKLSREDLEAIKEGLLKPEEIIEKNVLHELNSVEEGTLLDNVKLLAWMVANKNLEIKIAIKLGSEETDIDSLYEYNKNLFHQKIGIFIDNNNNKLSFSGSLNETMGGWKTNIEEFKVFKSWEKGSRKYLECDLEKFFRYWENKSPSLRTYSIPEAAKLRLIKLAPKDLDDLAYLNPHKKQNKIIQLRGYQKKAIENWFKNGEKGILEMATGTGKTITSIMILKELQKKYSRLFTVITVPYIHLVTQWKRELKKFGIDALEYHSEKKENVDLNIFNYRHKITNQIVIITVHATFSSNSFVKIISKINDLFLIADECHWLGAKKRRLGLIQEYSKRLGLSATPFRWLDQEGTNFLLSYFDKIVFKFTLGDAIPIYLTPYKYYPILVEFTPDEIKAYQKFSENIGAIIAKNELNMKDKIRLYSVKRANLVINAKNKYKLFEDLVKSFPRSISHCLVYCSPEQLRTIQKIINKRGFLQHKITQKEGMKEREIYIEKFAKGEYKFLTAIKCLDEGVDIPATKIAFFLSNRENPKEFIQRRGRILRKFENKEFAEIYDFIVIPPAQNLAGNKISRKMEISFIKREFDRYIEFASLALNSEECIKTLKNYISKIEGFDE